MFHLRNSIFEAFGNFVYKALCNGFLLGFHYSSKFVKFFCPSPQRCLGPELLCSFGLIHTLVHLVLSAGCKKSSKTRFKLIFHVQKCHWYQYKCLSYIAKYNFKVAWIAMLWEDADLFERPGIMEEETIIHGLLLQEWSRLQSALENSGC